MKDRIADLMLALLTVAAGPSFAQAPPASASPGAPTTAPSTSTAPANAAATADVQRPKNAVLGAAPDANVRIGRVLLGSGEPGGGPGGTYENATQVFNNLFHAPQYMPFFPTAATIWPRVIEVPCRQSGADLVCDRYYWRPEYGRGEYLFFTPVVQSAAASGAPATAPPAPQTR